MTRRSTSGQVASFPAVTPKKRASSPAEETSRRQSKRTRSVVATPASSNTTPKKSQYFEHASEESEPETGADEEESGYEGEETSVASSAPASEKEEEENDYSEKEVLPRRKVGRKSDGGAVKVTKGQELWRHGVKTGLGPGKQIFIKIPKAREGGKTPYTDDTIHPNTFLFLGDLADNNDREWLKSKLFTGQYSGLLCLESIAITHLYDADYRTSKKDFDTFVESLTEKIIEKDETIPELPPKDLTFRIYRDIRFSPDPTPYKTYFSAAWSRTGRKGPYAGYYVQLQPGGSFVGGGLWMPEPQPLALLRRDVDRKSHRIKRVLVDAGLRREFFGGIPKDEKRAVKAFVSQNTENALKTKPKVS
ncbi:MAG: hypothetical protein M1830_002805 [Pleopsidium flavum]|nr:MAG: hypothetical protein M1830_002805 [Pleopsidium flavum]